MKIKRLRRRLRIFAGRLRGAGKLRTLAGSLVVAAAIAFHVTIATSLVDQQPGDTKLYVQIARNVLEQGVFSGEFEPPYAPTLIRTPGYPLFLAAIYEFFGIANETSVRMVQAFICTFTCLLVALIAWQWVDDRSRRAKAAWSAFILSAFCPFIVIFSPTILTENATMFLLAATILAATFAIKARKKKRSGIWWFVAGLLGGLNVTFRPDSGLFAFGIGLTLVVSVFFGRGTFRTRLIDRFWKGVVFSFAFAIPLIPWTIRNEQLFGVFQPLAPSHAEMPGEFVPRGYLLWLRTWVDDSKYIDPLIWAIEERPLKIEDVPAYAFASDEEKQKVAELFAVYNNSDPDRPAIPPKLKTDEDVDSDDDKDNSDASGSGDSGNDDSDEWNLKISPEVDAEFAKIGEEHVARDPWHYYVWLPAKRSTSMWFDTHSDFYSFAGELFPLPDLDTDKHQDIWLPLFATLDIVFTIFAIGGAFVLILMRKARSWTWLFLALAISLPRIVFFGTIENPEPRYFVELFIPAAILSGVFLACLRFRKGKGSFGIELNYGSE